MADTRKNTILPYFLKDMPATLKPDEKKEPSPILQKISDLFFNKDEKHASEPDTTKKLVLNNAKASGISFGLGFVSYYLAKFSNNLGVFRSIDKKITSGATSNNIDVISNPSIITSSYLYGSSSAVYTAIYGVRAAAAKLFPENKTIDKTALDNKSILMGGLEPIAKSIANYNASYKDFLNGLGKTAFNTTIAIGAYAAAHKAMPFEADNVLKFSAKLAGIASISHGAYSVGNYVYDKVLAKPVEKISNVAGKVLEVPTTFISDFIRLQLAKNKNTSQQI